MNWISVKDRLPDVGKEVLTYGSDGIKADSYAFQSTISDKPVFEGDHNEYNYGVTHWMPLPEPPKQ